MGVNLITRGYFIGQVIDELTAVSHQVQSRAGLQLYDLNRYLEDFLKDILNIVLDCNLKNLNEERSNNPGLDLGDDKKGIAFQVTSTKSSEKVNKTLDNAIDHKATFPTIYVLILGAKQGSYTLDPELAKPFGFTAEEHIWDMEDVLKKVMSLPINRLQDLHDLVSKEVARVKIELEVPDKHGKYQTNLDSYIEQIPWERFEGISSYYKFLKEYAEENSDTYEVEEVEIGKDFKKFIKSLKRLPRITRQFYSFLLQRGEWDETRKFINNDYLRRVCNFPDLDGELRLLTDAELCWFREPDEHGESATWRIETVSRSKSYEFTLEFMEFIKKKDISLDKVLVSLDFSDFK
nr:SMEK domain-containing protein [Burkholderia multivorans]